MPSPIAPARASTSPVVEGDYSTPHPPAGRRGLQFHHASLLQLWVCLLCWEAFASTLCKEKRMPNLPAWYLTEHCCKPRGWLIQRRCNNECTTKEATNLITNLIVKKPPVRPWKKGSVRALAFLLFQYHPDSCPNPDISAGNVFPLSGQRCQDLGTRCVHWYWGITFSWPFHQWEVGNTWMCTDTYIHINM